MIASEFITGRLVLAIERPASDFDTTRTLEKFWECVMRLVEDERVQKKLARQDG